MVKKNQHRQAPQQGQGNIQRQASPTQAPQQSQQPRQQEKQQRQQQGRQERPHNREGQN